MELKRGRGRPKGSKNKINKELIFLFNTEKGIIPLKLSELEKLIGEMNLIKKQYCD